MNRLLLVRHGPTRATLRRAFPTDEPLTPDGRVAAAELSRYLPDDAHTFTSPALRCRQTAAAAGLTADVDERLAECDFGSWAGLTLAEVNARHPAAAAAWMTDPAARPHGGESLRALADRVDGWLADQHAWTTVAFTHGGIIRTAVTRLLGLPLSAAWRISPAPLSVTELVWDNHHWHLVPNNPGATGHDNAVRAEMTTQTSLGLPRMPGLIAKLDHCVIHVSDWAVSNQFYRDVLGAKLIDRGHGTWAYRFGTEQLNVHGPGATPGPVARIPVGPGNSDLCFEWDGPIDDAIAHLKRYDVEIEVGPSERNGARGHGTSVYFRDPDGSLMEFISYHS